ncbi:MAG: hypothetical protein QNJ23_09320 [Woeseiaceae bacterium]|nr:hypothetical protein [Woeseiaceae bacterium]
MAINKASTGFFVAAVAVYVLLGVVLPEITYTPDAQIEGGWNAVQMTKAIAEIAAPIIALILAALGFLALFRKQK